jgi:ABC-2 type transport system ATP-binding protein
MDERMGGRSGSEKPVIACQALTKVFRDFWMRSRAKAVDSVNLEVRQHEVFGLLGPNGSGKSTTIKMMLGLLRPTSGRIAVFGKPPADVSIKSRIGYLPEESYLYPFLNARETLDYYGKLFGLDHRVRMRRIDELLDMVGLKGAQFRPVREYSKGMQRRIGLAQALINDPELLILDEPTTGLDPIGTRQVKDLIIQLGQRGKTVLLSSHLLADVEDCVDRMVILYGGKIRREGERNELLEARSRTTIETEALDEGTIAEIDRVIRARTGGEEAIIRVSHPRQKLEELFLDIVHQAQEEQVETSGVTHAGETAAFLRDGESAQGEALIDRLVSEGEADDSLDVADASQKAVAEVDQGADVIGSLLADANPVDEPTEEQTPASASAATEPEHVDTSEVDLSLIDALVEEDDEDQPEPTT